MERLWQAFFYSIGIVALRRQQQSAGSGIANLNYILANYVVIYCCITHLNRYCISLYPTDDKSLPHQTNSFDAQASLRAEILQQISAAHDEVSKVLAQLGSGDTGRIQIALQLSNLSALRQQASLANGTTLQQMQALIAKTVANAQALATGSTEMDGSSPAEKLAEASAKARQTAQDFVRDYYGNHEFDKYLEFKSEQDERDYREREAARNKAIEDALALQSEKGNALALKLSNEQWVDAKAHGASRSPDAQAMTEKLDEASQKLDAAVLAADSPSPSVNQADQHIAVLKKAGVTVADQTQQGHGVTVDASIAQLLGRG